MSGEGAIKKAREGLGEDATVSEAEGLFRPSPLAVAD